VTDREWREQLKVGDEVLIPLRHSNAYSPGKVTKVTPKQLVISGNGRETRHDKSTGWERGAGYGGRGFYQPTPERLEAAELCKLQRRVRRVVELVTIPDDRAGLESLLAVLTPFVKEPS
jgi:hypothetical protein